MYGHLTFSLVALVTALFAGLRAKARRADGVPMVPGLGRTVNLLVGIQFTLGVLAFLATVLRRTTEIPIWELIPTSAHQANGALLLGAAAALLVAIRRFEKPSKSGNRVIQNAATVVG
jgi:heme A synthase